MSIIIYKGSISLPTSYQSIDPHEDQIASLVFKYQNSKNKYERDELAEVLIKSFEGDIKVLANKLASNKAKVSKEELVQIGRIVLLDKAKSFDFSIGTKFWTFAQKRIFGAMKDEIRSELAELGVDRHGKQAGPGKIFLSESLHSDSGKGTFGDTLIGETGLDLTETHDYQLIGYTFPKQDHPIYHFGNILTRREMIVLDLYYGLTGKEHQKNMKEIGDIFGLVESRISQILREIEKKIKPYAEIISEQELLKEDFKHLADPAYVLLSEVADKKDLPFTYEDLRFLAGCEDLLSEEEKKVLTLIKGTDNEYGIPHTNGELMEVLNLNRTREINAYKESLAKKLLFLIQFEKRKNKWTKSTTKGWFLSPQEIKIIFAGLDKGTCNPRDVISSLLPRLGYKTLQADEELDGSNKQELIRIISTSNLECHFESSTVIDVINAALTEQADSFYGRVLRKYPETFEHVLETLADKYMIEFLKRVNEQTQIKGSITFEELGDIYSNVCHGIRPSLRTLKRYAEVFQLNVIPSKRGSYRQIA